MQSASSPPGLSHFTRRTLHAAQLRFWADLSNGAGEADASSPVDVLTADEWGGALFDPEATVEP